MAFKDFWGTDWPEWKKWAALQTRYDMRWFYRWSGKKVPKLPFEKDRTQADSIEELMNKE